MKSKISLYFVFQLMSILNYGQTTKTVYVFPNGTLSSLLTSIEKNTINKLIVNGTIDYRDFSTMRSMPALTSVDLSGTLIYNPDNEIPSGAFSGCTKLKSIILPENINVINPEAFYDCSSLDTIILPESTQIIDDFVFTGCSSLTSINIPNSVTYIGENAFGNCSSLFSITIAGLITSLNKDVFSGCTNLNSVSLPNSVTFIDDNAFLNCDKLTSINPLYNLKYIGRYAFSNCTNLSRFHIPNTIDSIGIGTFSGCLNLDSISIPNTITKINNEVFHSCQKLTTLTLPNSLKYIGDAAFFDCKSLMEIKIPDSVNWIGENAFYYCLNIKSVKLPNKLSKINCATFSDCLALGSINLPDSLLYIDNSAFSGCSNLKILSIPKGLRTIGDYAFSGCVSIDSINLPNQLYSIGASAFGNCRNLKSFIIPDSVKVINENVFNSSGLTSIIIPQTINSIEKYAFAYCHSLETIFIPNTITQIKEGLFRDCSKLANIIIPNAATSIENLAFEGCISLKSITIPEKITFIGNSVFSDCKGLISIFAQPLIPVDLSNSSNVFYNVDKNLCTLYVPTSSIDAYQKADQWKDFFYLEEKKNENSTSQINIPITQDCSASQAQPTTNLNGKNLRVSFFEVQSGINCDTCGRVFYLKADISIIPKYSNIISAYLILKETFYFFPVNLVIYRITQPWNETILTFNNQPSYDYPETTTDDFHFINILTYAKSWHKGEYSNFGLLIGGGYNSLPKKIPTFYDKESSIAINHPYFKIEYSNPDISIENTWISNSTSRKGDYIDLSCNQTYKNGSSHIVYPKIGYFLSSDTLYDPMDIFLSSDSSCLAGLDSSNYESEKIQIPLSTEPGSYFLLFVSDFHNNISESDESNNCSYKQVNVSTTTDYKINPIDPKENIIQIFPNPVLTKLYIKNIIREGIISIFSKEGILIKKLKTNSSSVEIDISDLPSGIYLTQIFTNNIFYKEKIIKL